MCWETTNDKYPRKGTIPRACILQHSRDWWVFFFLKKQIVFATNQSFVSIAKMGLQRQWALCLWICGSAVMQITTELKEDVSRTIPMYTEILAEYYDIKGKTAPKSGVVSSKWPNEASGLTYVYWTIFQHHRSCNLQPVIQENTPCVKVSPCWLGKVSQNKLQ